MLSAFHSVFVCSIATFINHRYHSQPGIRHFSFASYFIKICALTATARLLWSCFFPCVQLSYVVSAHIFVRRITARPVNVNSFLQFKLSYLFGIY